MKIQAKMGTHPGFVREVDGQTSFVTKGGDRKVGLKGILKETVKIIFHLKVKNTSMSKKERKEVKLKTEKMK